MQEIVGAGPSTHLCCSTRLAMPSPSSPLDHAVLPFPPCPPIRTSSSSLSTHLLPIHRRLLRLQVPLQQLPRRDVSTIVLALAGKPRPEAPETLPTLHVLEVRHLLAILHDDLIEILTIVRRLREPLRRRLKIVEEPPLQRVHQELDLPFGLVVEVETLEHVVERYALLNPNGAVEGTEMLLVALPLQGRDTLEVGWQLVGLVVAAEVWCEVEFDLEAWAGALELREIARAGVCDTEALEC